jgi:hypothetical protein
MGIDKDHPDGTKDTRKLFLRWTETLPRRTETGIVHDQEKGGTGKRVNDDEEEERRTEGYANDLDRWKEERPGMSRAEIKRPTQKAADDSVMNEVDHGAKRRK